MLQRTPRGVEPTDAGAAFFREAQLTLQPREAVGPAPDAAQCFALVHIDDPQASRINPLCSLSEDELSLAALVPGS